MKLETVKRIYRELNARNFGGVLEEPRIYFCRSNNMDAHYSSRGLGFNLADTKGLFAVRELVYHEMLHQYIDEFLELETLDDHGKEFKKQYNKFLTADFFHDPDYHYSE